MAKKVDVHTVEFLIGKPAFDYDAAYQGYKSRTSTDGVLYRLVNTSRRQWAFYNDIADAVVQVRATLSAGSTAQPLSDRIAVNVVPHADGTVDDTCRREFVVDVAPGATEPFLQGCVTGFSLLFHSEAVPLSNPQFEGPTPPTVPYNKVYRCFEGSGNGLLFRLVDDTTHTWYFYNDTPNYKMKVQAVFEDPNAVQPLGQTVVAEAPADGSPGVVYEVDVPPGETQPFMTGMPHNSHLHFAAAYETLTEVPGEDGSTDYTNDAGNSAAPHAAAVPHEATPSGNAQPAGSGSAAPYASTTPSAHGAPAYHAAGQPTGSTPAQEPAAVSQTPSQPAYTPIAPAQRVAPLSNGYPAPAHETAATAPPPPSVPPLPSTVPAAHSATPATASAPASVPPSASSRGAAVPPPPPPPSATVQPHAPQPYEIPPPSSNATEGSAVPSSAPTPASHYPPAAPDGSSSHGVPVPPPSSSSHSAVPQPHVMPTPPATAHSIPSSQPSITPDHQQYQLPAPHAVQPTPTPTPHAVSSTPDHPVPSSHGDHAPPQPNDDHQHWQQPTPLHPGEAHPASHTHNSSRPTSKAVSSSVDPEEERSALARLQNPGSENHPRFDGPGPNPRVIDPNQSYIYYRDEPGTPMYRIQEWSYREWFFYNDSTDTIITAHVVIEDPETVRAVGKTRVLGAPGDGSPGMEYSLEIMPGATEPFITGYPSKYRVTFTNEPAPLGTNEQSAHDAGDDTQRVCNYHRKKGPNRSVAIPSPMFDGPGPDTSVIDYDQVFGCFKDQPTPMLYRLMDQKECWGFYNDTANGYLTARVSFDKAARVRPLGRTTIEQDPEMGLTYVLEIGPGSTELFVQGEVHVFQANYTAFFPPSEGDEEEYEEY